MGNKVAHPKRLLRDYQRLDEDRVYGLPEDFLFFARILARNPPKRRIA